MVPLGITRANVPDYMVRGGTAYRIIPDHLGSPRFVVDVATGVVAQELRYDEFGRVTLDTNPGFQPFGFAGGLYDHQTGLVRFGARDYDPEIGRWTTPDPSGFAGGLNLYVYADQSPQSFVDRSGEIPVAAGIAIAWGLLEAGLTIWDVYETGSTLMDPCASLGEKVFAGGLAAAGGIFPGAGYGAGGKAGKKALGAGKKSGGVPTHASTPVGRRSGPGQSGSDAPQPNGAGRHNPQHKNGAHQPSQNMSSVIGGRGFSGHALDQMRNRGLVPSVVENTIRTGQQLPGHNASTLVFYDPVNSVRVVVNQAGNVITVK